MDLIHPDDRNNVLKQSSNAIENKNNTQHNITYRIIRPDNQHIRWIKVISAIHRGDAKVALRITGFVYDITKETEQAKKEAQLNELKSVLSDFMTD